MNLTEAYPLVAAAIKKATEEHGRPNTFSPGELEAYYGAPPALITGRVLSHDYYRVRVWELLGGRDGWGSAPRYEKRRVAV